MKIDLNRALRDKKDDLPITGENQKVITLMDVISNGIYHGVSAKDRFEQGFYNKITDFVLKLVSNGKEVDEKSGNEFYIQFGDADYHFEITVEEMQIFESWIYQLGYKAVLIRAILDIINNPVV